MIWGLGGVFWDWVRWVLGCGFGVLRRDRLGLWVGSLGFRGRGVVLGHVGLGGRVGWGFGGLGGQIWALGELVLDWAW